MVRAILEAVYTLEDNGMHNAFTAMATWRGKIWVGYRSAVSHGITPPGVVNILAGDSGPQSLQQHHRFHLPHTDLRDPRFLATKDALFCFMGGYNAGSSERGLSSNSAENIIRTYCAHTVNGTTWTPPVPILRPNYWGWGMLYSEVFRQGKNTSLYYLAAYHTGAHEETSSLHLYLGISPYRLLPLAVMYDGAGRVEDAPHYSPSEPVLFAINNYTMGCYARTEGSMDLGVSINPFQDWRWHRTPYTIHPSSVYTMANATRIVAGRHISQKNKHEYPQSTVQLFTAQAQYLSPLLTLPGKGDCAYIGITQGLRVENEIYASYYAQSLTESFALPGSNIYIATVSLL